MNGTGIQKFLAVLNQQKILGHVCFSEQIFYRKQSLGVSVLLAVNICFICSFSFYYYNYNYNYYYYYYYFVCLRVGVMSAGCRTVAILNCFANLVPRAFPSKNGWGGKSPTHFLREKPWGRGCCFARPPRVEVLFILIHCGHWSDLTCFSIDYRLIISFLAKRN